MPRRRTNHAPLIVSAVFLLIVIIGLSDAWNKQTTTAASKPNIVIILADDQPALDGRLIEYMPTTKQIFKDQGITFTNYYGSSPLCCPGRANLWTGQYTHNHGVISNSAKLLNPIMTMATQLNSVGYHTYYVGKYLNAYAKIAPGVPPGWDRFSAMEAGYYSYQFWNDGNPTTEYHGTAETDYSTDVIRNKAVDFITNAPSDQPIFLIAAPYAPHDQAIPAPRHKAAASCKSIPAWAPPNYNEADVSDKPTYVQNTSLRVKPNFNLVKYCQTMLAVDDLVAALKDTLSQTGRLQNTIFIYAGDNGMEMGAHRLGGKSAPYITELPFYLSWPAALGSSSPRTIEEYVANVDVAPTLCEVAGCNMGPYPNGQLTPDGRSFLSLLTSGTSSLGREMLLDEMPGGYGKIPPWYAIRTTPLSPLGLWHYVEYDNGEKELYDLSGGPCWMWSQGKPGDPCEMQNIVNDPDKAALVQALHDELIKLKTTKGN